MSTIRFNLYDKDRFFKKDLIFQNTISFDENYLNYNSKYVHLKI